jgi:hypothetical protein
MSPSLATILEKKSLELSERRKRAQDSIRLAIKTANIYSNGAVLEINTKDGKERVFEALKKMVESKYYSFGKVKFSFDTINAIMDELNAAEGGLGDWPNMDANKDAYEEIKTKLKTDKNNSRISTVKTLIDYFGKAPYGWKDLDIRGLIGVMWKHHAIKLDIHGKSLSISNSSDKNEFARGNKADSISVKLQEKIDEQILNDVRKIIKSVFNENYPLNEEQLRKGIFELIEKKVEQLKNIQIKYEGKSYPGKNRVFEIQRELATIIKNDDASYVFSQITAKKNFLEENADHLDEILSFYQQGSAQLKNYNEASEIYTWYQQNRILENLTDVDDFMERIMNILSDDHPFGKMVELGQLVLKVKQIKDTMHQEKVSKATEKLEKDLNLIRNEAEQAKAKITDSIKIEQLETTLSELENKYNDLLSSIKEARNLDQYMTSSTSNLEGFRRLIQSLVVKNDPDKKTKHIRLSSLVPIANKKITNQEDINKVVTDIKERLEEELKDTDEISID